MHRKIITRILLFAICIAALSGTVNASGPLDTIDGAGSAMKQVYTLITAIALPLAVISIVVGACKFFGLSILSFLNREKQLEAGRRQIVITLVALACLYLMPAVIMLAYDFVQDYKWTPNSSEEHLSWSGNSFDDNGALDTLVTGNAEDIPLTFDKIIQDTCKDYNILNDTAYSVDDFTGYFYNTEKGWPWSDTGNPETVENAKTFYYYYIGSPYDSIHSEKYKFSNAAASDCNSQTITISPQAQATACKDAGALSYTYDEIIFMNSLASDYYGTYSTICTGEYCHGIISLATIEQKQTKGGDKRCWPAYCVL